MIPQRGVVLSTSAAVTRADDLRSEQAYLSTLYARLDRLREQANERLRGILLESGGTPQGRTQREATRSHYTEQLAQMNAVPRRRARSISPPPSRPRASPAAGTCAPRAGCSPTSTTRCSISSPARP